MNHEARKTLFKAFTRNITSLVGTILTYITVVKVGVAPIGMPTLIKIGSEK